MNALVLMLIPATLGVDFGWERQPDNSIEYILQIEPEAVDSMKTGTELVSSLPPALRNIRDYRIRVGRDRLPNQNVIPPELSAGAATPNINTGTYSTANNFPASSASTYPPNNGAFVNNSTSPPYNPNTQYAPPGTLAGGPATGMSAIGGSSTVPTSTSGFPLQTTNATYPTGAGNQYVGNLPPPPSNYPNNGAGYATNPYPAGTAQQPGGYAAAGYNPATGAYGTNNNTTSNYGTNGYAPAGYNQPTNNYQQPPYQGQPYQQSPQQQNPYGRHHQEYLAQNNTPAIPFGAAKPSLNDPANPAGTAGFGTPNYAGTPTGAFPGGTQYTPPGANPMGSIPPGGYLPSLGPPPGAPVPPLGSFALNQQQPGTMPLTTVGNTNVDPHGVPNQATTKDQSQSQWASLSFALVALFASLGANIWIFWQNHFLRERCRVLMTDRPAY